MTDLTPEEIVKALREIEHGTADRPIGSEEWAAHAYATAPKAADMIERMGKVLEPFAVVADWFDSFDNPPPDANTTVYGEAGQSPSIGDYRRARAELAGKAGERGG